MDWNRLPLKQQIVSHISIRSFHHLHGSTNFKVVEGHQNDCSISSGISYQVGHRQVDRGFE